jgi:hypothetical protein
MVRGNSLLLQVYFASKLVNKRKSAAAYLHLLCLVQLLQRPIFKKQLDRRTQVSLVDAKNVTTNQETIRHWEGSSGGKGLVGSAMGAMGSSFPGIGPNAT